MATDTLGGGGGGDLAHAVDTVFNRLADYFPPPVYVGRMRSLIISTAVALCVFTIAAIPANANRKKAKTPMEEVAAIGIIVACFLVAILLQQMVSGIVYNLDMYTVNRQHFANTHWLRQYTKSSTSLI